MNSSAKTLNGYNSHFHASASKNGMYFFTHTFHVFEPVKKLQSIYRTREENAVIVVFMYFPSLFGQTNIHTF